MRWAYFECKQGHKRRFYRLIAQDGLFGGPVLVREWGRIGSRGQILTRACDDHAELEACWQELCAARLRRGYIPVTPTTSSPSLNRYIAAAS